MADTAAQLLGGPVYHYQSKLTAKEPRVGGAWEWHQDYGYWYYTGCLRPDMLSVMIGLDRTTRENGCLQIATGSHRMGRIDHTPLSPTQNEVDPQRMPHILERCPIEYCELDPGDALIFHCNAIHRSDANRSDHRRWTLLICYNRTDNDTITKTDDRYFVPLDVVDDGALRQAGLKFAAGDNAEHFTSRPYVPDVRKAA
jgi:ectoine hydroxylase-related dioxygenase (phytanoyl-CoA dioxygenase family)